jgi:hypothetical protein
LTREKDFRLLIMNPIYEEEIMEILDGFNIIIPPNRCRTC